MNDILINCLTCKKEFRPRNCPSDIKSGRGKYCSRECGRKAQIKLQQVFLCPNCKREFPNRHGKISKYCSKKCANEARIGETPWNKGKKSSPEAIKKASLARRGSIPWNKGLKGVMPVPWNKGNDKTDLKRRIRQHPLMIEWRNAVYKRDKWLCQVCRVKKKKNHAHHIKRFEYIVKEYELKTIDDAIKCKELWDISNGITICEPCHKEDHAIRREAIKIAEQMVKDGRAEKRVLPNGITEYRYLKRKYIKKN